MQPNIEILIEALNNPNSPMRMKLLDSLAMSPLDPAAAFQQIQQETASMGLGGVPPAPQEKTPGMGDIFDPQEPMTLPPMTPKMGTLGDAGGSRGPWSFDYSDKSPMNPALASGTPSEPMPDGTTPPVTPEDPEKKKLEALKKMFEGAGAGGHKDLRPFPSSGGAGSNSWRGFNAAMLNTPAVAPHITLAQLLEGK